MSVAPRIVGAGRAVGAASPASRLGGEGVESVQFGMGTAIAHHAFGVGASSALVAAEAEVVRLEGLLSRFQPTSEVSAIARRAGLGSVEVTAETYEVLAQAQACARLCDGHFDPTVGPLLDVWRHAAAELQAPSASDVARALSLVDYRDLTLDPVARSVALRREGQALDLGGVGKGFSADRVLQVYRERGVSSAFVNLGGNVAALGTKPDGSPWRVGIRHPRDGEELLGLVAVAEKSVVTSGDYQRCFADESGRRYHHIVDPATGYPADAGLLSVTIVADSSTLADALSTAVFVAGASRGLALVRACPGAEAVLVDAEMRVHVTRGLLGAFQAAETIDAVVV